MTELKPNGFSVAEIRRTIAPHFSGAVYELIRSIAEKKAELARLRAAAPTAPTNFEHVQDLEPAYTSNVPFISTLYSSNRPGAARTPSTACFMNDWMPAWGTP